jgi:DNA-binding response OmpR family regulator
LCKRADIAENVFDVEHSDISAVELKFLDKDQINTNISRLRKAVEPNPNHPKYIVTVHGVGYKLVLGDVARRDE